jgi:histidinol-phosphatase (PHP family)
LTCADINHDQIEAGNTVSELRSRHDAYICEAIRLRDKYASSIKILIGFEGEWIRPSSADMVSTLLQIPGTDFFIGSVHHVHEIPIDFDKAMYQKARHVAGGTDERLFEDYFDAQFEMLKALQPPVVGHFDLIRLLSDDPNVEFRSMEGVWERVLRNLTLIAEQGGLLEVNSSALRKGLKEPYPSRSICQVSSRIIAGEENTDCGYRYS